jgi:TRAP-type C4-dicarboxylate transport system permease small subunit
MTDMKLISTIAGVIAALCMAAMALLLLAEILLRPFGVLVPSADDFTTFLMIGVGFFGFVHAFHEGAHVRVDLLFRRLPARIQHGLQVASLFLAALLLAGLTLGSAEMTWAAYRFHDVTDTLIPVPMALLLGSATLGLGLFTLLCLWSGLRSLAGGAITFAVGEKEEAMALARASDSDSEGELA